MKAHEQLGHHGASEDSGASGPEYSSESPCLLKNSEDANGFRPCG